MLLQYIQAGLLLKKKMPVDQDQKKLDEIKIKQELQILAEQVLMMHLLLLLDSSMI